MPGSDAPESQTRNVEPLARRIHERCPIIGDTAQPWPTLPPERQGAYRAVVTASCDGTSPDLGPWLASQRETLVTMLAHERFATEPDSARPDNLVAILTAVRR